MKNELEVIGNLGRDCEVSYTKGGTAVARFSVAMGSGFGESEKTDWVDCSLFGKRAEGGLVAYLKKGQQVFVKGEASLDAWTGKDGSPKTTLKMWVKEIRPLGAKSEAAKPAPKPAEPDLADDIPF